MCRACRFLTPTSSFGAPHGRCMPAVRRNPTSRHQRPRGNDPLRHLHALTVGPVTFPQPPAVPDVASWPAEQTRIHAVIGPSGPSTARSRARATGTEGYLSLRTPPRQEFGFLISARAGREDRHPCAGVRVFERAPFRRHDLRGLTTPQLDPILARVKPSTPCPPAHSRSHRNSRSSLGSAGRAPLTPSRVELRVVQGGRNGGAPSQGATATPR